MAVPDATSSPDIHELPGLVTLAPPAGTFPRWGANQSRFPSVMPALSPVPDKTQRVPMPAVPPPSRGRFVACTPHPPWQWHGAAQQ